MARQTEPCNTCGENTAAGSTHYSDRRVIDDDGAGTAFQCSTCAAQAAASRRHSPMTDAERRELEKGAAVFGAFAPGGH
jgi:hypothetical protein